MTPLTVQVVFASLASRLFRLGLTPHCLLCLDAAVSGLGVSPLSPDTTKAHGTSIPQLRPRGSSCDDITAADVSGTRADAMNKEASHVDTRTGCVDLLMEAGGFELDGEGTVASQQSAHPSAPPRYSTILATSSPSGRSPLTHPTLHPPSSRSHIPYTSRHRCFQCPTSPRTRSWSVPPSPRSSGASRSTAARGRQRRAARAASCRLRRWEGRRRRLAITRCSWRHTRWRCCRQTAAPLRPPHPLRATCSSQKVSG